MRKTLKAVAGLCVVAGTLFLTAPSAGAQEGCGGYFNPCPPDSLEYEYPAVIQQGTESIEVNGTVVGEDFRRASRAAGDAVEFEINEQPAGSIVPEADGTFTVRLTGTSSLAVGKYPIVGVYGDLVAEGEFEVVARSTNPPGGGSNNPNTYTPNTNSTNSGSSNTPLARTGFDAAPLVTLGAAAVVLGGAAVYGTRRRRLAA